MARNTKDIVSRASRSRKARVDSSLLSSRRLTPLFKESRNPEFLCERKRQVIELYELFRPFAIPHVRRKVRSSSVRRSFERVLPFFLPRKFLICFPLSYPTLFHVGKVKIARNRRSPLSRQRTFITNCMLFLVLSLPLSFFLFSFLFCFFLPHPLFLSLSTTSYISRNYVSSNFATPTSLS